ncbi:cation diffusion facilitator family transporter [Nesterenkonia ebinurensis]|uniref:cation diffusion facilitator family transporter n=1 Tax=Nesterenkonia ebinurensis TaxID=2608252 RepID=UPI00123E0611|nr:cation diffusion facilitator family transporter [Nesterenkonia ebinurensis]
MAKKKVSDTRVVLTSTVVSVFDVSLNAFVAIVTGSTVMLSQALQGLSDMMTGIVLFVGVKKSKRRPDTQFQFGYGREVFFWALIAGIIMFGGTGLASVYFGYQQFIRPEPVDNIWLAFIVLFFSFCTNAYSFSLSFRRLRQSGGTAGWLRRLRHSSLIETKATFFLDSIGTTATGIGIIALLLFALTGDSRLDGAGGIAIGMTMMCAAMLLILDIRGLIVGRGAGQTTSRRIIDVAESVTNVRSVLDLRTMYLGSDKLLVILEVHLKDGLDTDTIEELIDTIKRTVTIAVPSVYSIQVEVETPDDELSDL